VASSGGFLRWLLPLRYRNRGCGQTYVAALMDSLNIATAVAADFPHEQTFLSR
jgi:hypothetical protein